MLVLYEFGNSVCCQKVRLVLCEKGVVWESRQVNLFRSEQYDPEYLKLNPKGLVPTLVHDGQPVIESTVICKYLEAIFPEPCLMPAGAYERARMRLWSKAVDEGLHEGVTEISFSAMFRERMKNMSESEREARFRNVGDPKRRDRFVSPTSSVSSHRSCFGRSPRTSGRSSRWTRRSPKAASGSLVVLLAFPRSILCPTLRGWST